MVWKTKEKKSAVEEQNKHIEGRHMTLVNFILLNRSNLGNRKFSFQHERDEIRVLTKLECSYVMH